MSLVDQGRTEYLREDTYATRAHLPPPRQRQQEQSPAFPVNVGSSERAVSVTAGAILAGFGIARRTLPGSVIAALGGALVFRGVTGHCHAYEALNINTAQPDDESQSEDLDQLNQSGIHVEQAFLIDRPVEELYQYWRNFENLPRIMDYLESVKVNGTSRSHWVAKAPSLVGGKVEWDAELTADEPNTRIAWRSLEGADVDNSGQVLFTKGLGDRGTQVNVTIKYMPPAGRVGNWIATLFGKSPEMEIREGLRNFKRIMEVGELPTIVGQPRGTCTGQGKRETK